MSSALLSYTTLFDCQKSPIVDIIDPSGITKSHAIVSDDGAQRLNLNAYAALYTFYGVFDEDKLGAVV